MHNKELLHKWLIASMVASLAYLSGQFLFIILFLIVFGRDSSYTSFDSEEPGMEIGPLDKGK